MADGTTRIYRFGPFVLDVADRSLKRQGAPISLTPKTFDLLVALADNAGRLVEKDALLRSVWPDVAVEEGNLTKGVFSLRQLLEEEGGPRYIETVPKRGYRFIAPITAENAERQPAAAAGPAATGTPENSIAVMPFTDMSAARDQEFFCEGMSEEIINALGRVPELRVASYTSSHAIQRERGRPTDDRAGTHGRLAAGGQRSQGWRHRANCRAAGAIG
jgi:DNA-binding winged helix-turn-helix (wHTH) protein